MISSYLSRAETVDHPDQAKLYVFASDDAGVLSISFGLGNFIPSV